MARFEYKPRTAAQVEKRATQQGGDFIGMIRDEYKTYAMKKGSNFIRILPPTWEDPEHFGMDIYVHFGVGPERGSLICLAKMKGTACPICEARTALERSGDQKAADEIKPSRRVAMWVLDRLDTAVKREEPLVLVCSWTVDRDISAQARDMRSGEVYLIDHPDEGYDIGFEKIGDSLQTKYTGFQLAKRPSSVPSYVLDYISEHPIPNTFMWRTYDEMRAIYEGAAGGGGAARDTQRSEPREERRGATAAREEEPRRGAVASRESPINERDVAAAEKSIAEEPPPRTTGRAQIKDEAKPADPAPAASGNAAQDRIAALRERMKGR
jgi:hypothetical protein